MASDNVKQFSDDRFETDVREAEAPVLVDFWAEWCAPCHVMSPVITELADEYAGRAIVGKMDVDANQRIAGELGISAIPTIVLYHHGEIVKRFTGVVPKNELAAELDKVLALQNA